MKLHHHLLILILIIAGAAAAGCSLSPDHTASPQGTTGALTTPSGLTELVTKAVAYARENGRERAVAAFNQPDGEFVRGEAYVFSEDYNGIALAEPFHPELVGTNIRNLTDPFGVPIVQNLRETARYGIGFVSYDYPNPKNNNRIEPKLTVIADVDGTYYLGCRSYDG